MHNKTLWIPVSCLAIAITLLHCAVAISGSPTFSLSGHPGVPCLDERSAEGTIKTLTRSDGLERGPAGLQHSVADTNGSATPDERAAARGNAPDEVQALKERIIEVQNKGKLGFRKIVPCRSVESFGIYSPIESGQKVDKIVFYCEPSNVSTLKSGDRYIIDCAVDFILIDSSGKVLAGRQDALKINRVSRSPVIDLFFKVEMELKKFLDRTVFLKTVLHDKIKNETVSVTKRINVEGARKATPNGI